MNASVPEKTALPAHGRLPPPRGLSGSPSVEGVRAFDGQVWKRI